MRNFGIECEVASGSGGVMQALGIDRMHGYHCGCEDCRPFRTHRDWTAQSDCTADGEFISRVLTYGTNEADVAIDTLAAALRTARADHSDEQGLHVHVSNNGLRGSRTRAARFWRMWFRYEEDIAALAAGSYEDVRDYNSPVPLTSVVGDGRGPYYREWDSFRGRYVDRYRPQDPARAKERLYKMAPGRLNTALPGRSWVNFHTGHDTVEFRLWNATRVAWRMHLAVGVSVALIEAACDPKLPLVEEDDPRSLVDLLYPYMTDRSLAALLRAWTHLEAA